MIPIFICLPHGNCGILESMCGGNFEVEESEQVETWTGQDPTVVAKRTMLDGDSLFVAHPMKDQEHTLEVLF